MRIASVENDPKIKCHYVSAGLTDPSVLIEGVLFRARYLGSTQLVCEGQPTKATRMMQAEEAVSRIKVMKCTYILIMDIIVRFKNTRT